VDETIGGQDRGAAKLIGTAVEAGDFSAGFLDEENASSDVPFGEAELPETVEATHGDGSEVERGGAVATHSMRPLGKLAIILKIGSGFAVAHREASAEQAGGESRIFGDVDFLAVETSAFGAGSGEKLVVEGIEDSGGEERVALRDGDGDAEARIAVSKIGGAIERVHVPAEFGGGSAFVAGAFFGGDGVVGKIFGEAFDDETFGALVGLSDDVHAFALVGEVERAGEFLDEDFAGFLGDFDGGFEAAFGGHGTGPCVGAKLHFSIGGRWRAEFQ